MPEEPPTPPPDPSAPRPPGHSVGTGFAGETTGSQANLPPLEEKTVLMPSGSSPTQVIGDYEVLGKLGQGGMGAVYRARQISLDRQVALKLLPTALEADADFVTRFQREARVAASLSHGNLVKVYASGQVDGTHYIAMELVEGETLGQWLKRGPLPPPEALRICGDVARALEHGWNRAQLIHRDIKPGNIFLSIHGDVKVGDLGLAKTLGGDTTGLTQTGTAMGTPHYISPEQARGESDLDFRADIYSLGCTLYQMLTGRTPYTGSDPMAVMSLHRDAPPPAILKVLPGCPIPFARLVGRMLKKNKRERQASYEELIAEIERVQVLFAPTESVLESTLPPDPDATLLVTPGHTPRSATPVTAAVVAPSKPSAPKSKAGLYGGIAAGIAVLVVVLFAVWPKEEKLTKAELYAKQREAEQAAAQQPTGEASSGASQTSARDQGRAAALPAVIKLWTDGTDLPTNDPRVRWENGVIWLNGTGAVRSVGALDFIVRGSIRANPDANGPVILFRTRMKDGAPSHYVFGLEAARGQVVLKILEASQDRLLQKWPLPRGYGPDEWVRMELKAVGDQFTASLDGQILGTVRDTTITQPGGINIFATANGYFRDIEYILLDGVSGSPATENWQPLIPESEWRLAGRSDREFKDGLLHVTRGPLTARQPAADAAIRARIHFREGSKGPQVRLRYTANRGSYNFAITDDFAAVQLVRFAAPAGSGITTATLARFPFAKARSPGDTLVLELRAQGRRLTGLVDGAVVIEADDDQLAEPGDCGIYAVDGWFESVEVRPLGAPTAEPWLDLLADPSRVNSTSGVAFAAGRLEIPKGGLARVRDAPADGAIRMATTFTSNNMAQLWARATGDRRYELTMTAASKVVLQRHEGEVFTRLADFQITPPLALGSRYELEFRAVGSTLTAKLNGTVVIEAQDVAISTGTFGVTNVAGEPLVLDALQFLAFDRTSPAASPSAATKDAPFVNSLGMNFVPVPITGGPTDGKRVLFSVWDVRVQDFEAFARETKSGWKKAADVEQGPEYPVVMVSWNDAQAFCKWLTERERKAGKLGADEVYRLPSDHEWSCAVGIGEREDATKQPSEKHLKITNEFPWGSAWPPPDSAGNYWSEEFRPVFAAGKLSWAKGELPGRRDGFATTSPVGAFAANRFGLYDLAGNVWQWCDDGFDKEEKERVLRGGAWHSVERTTPLSSYRYRSVGYVRAVNFGFRIVLAPIP